MHFQAYDDDDRNVRKAAVDVLVQIYMRVGEQIWLHIQGIGEAKVCWSQFLVDQMFHHLYALT